VKLEASLESLPISGARRALKRAGDLCISMSLLIVLCPVLAVLCFLIKLQDRGPALHRRRVIGPGGEFDAFKLRTMWVDADEILRRNAELRREFEINFKLKNDPRVTPLGALLRKVSLDELPQLWNVAVGEMSLVGPRMITPQELEKYGAAGWIFHRVRPGLTGYWQVQGRQDLSYAQRVEMDLFYVKNWSLLLDLKILVKTPIRVVRGRGAY
jgi:lipopolysaccharide/colanic/teichoic acid biosynthesis glycosyltransferase